MPLEKFKVDGRDYKMIPINMVFYNDCTNSVCYQVTATETEDYSNNNTLWHQVGRYSSSKNEGTFRQDGLQSLIDDSWSNDFDIILVSNWREISDDPRIVEYVLANLNPHVSIFCMEDETILSYYPKEIDRTLLHNLIRSFSREYEEYLARDDYYQMPEMEDGYEDTK